MEAFRRAKNKFPGRQKIVVSNKWGFTNLTRLEYQKYKSEGKLKLNGAFATLIGEKGRLSESPLFKIERAVAKKK